MQSVRVARQPQRRLAAGLSVTGDNRGCTGARRRVLLGRQASRRLAAILLVTTSLSALLTAVAPPAWANGGAGGGGAAGGTDSTTGVGGAGGSGGGSAGGGGGAGITGGAGGDGPGAPPALGGTGGVAGGGNGTNGGLGIMGGAGGGGGGAHTIVTGTITLPAGVEVGGNGGNGGIGNNGGGGGGGGGGAAALVTGVGASSNAASLTGGAGGGGGGSLLAGSSSGGGGSGGAGAQFTAAGGSLANTGTVRGGNGGAGGSSFAGFGGAGGAGGAGLVATGLAVTNTGSIVGGNGGAGGTGTTAGANGVGGSGIAGSGLTVINSGTITGGLGGDGVTRANAITFTGGTNTLTLQAGSTITGNVVAFSAADTLTLGGSTSSSFDASQIGSAAQVQNFGQFQKTGTSTWTLTGTTTATTNWAINGGALAISSDSSLGATTGTLSFNGGALQTTSTLSTARTVTLNAGGGALSPAAGTALTMTGAIGGTGGLTVNGPGTVILAGTNTYTGGTTVSGGILSGTTSSLQGNITNNATVQFNQATSGTYSGVISGTGSVAIQGGGTVTFSGANTYTGATTVSGGTLVVNGSLASSVTLGSGGLLGGSGTIGGLVSNGATLAPGNSIGTLTVNGNFSQIGGTYVVEANAQGQSDRINVSGTATISGATVQVVAAAGNYGTSTTYTILNATGGVSGTYSGVSSNLAFLTPSLSYDANNVFLTLALQGNAFSGFGGNTVNQRNVGYALDQSYVTATGDFLTVVGALANLSTSQAGPALNAISGQPYADLGSFNVANNALFMNALGQQMALARGSAAGGQRLALAEACDVVCDGASPFSVWGSVLGGVGSVQGDGNSSTFTYNVGGAAAGIDYRVDPRFLVGIGTGYTSGTQWVDSFMGKGWSNTVSVAAYGSFTQSGLYVDALAGYAWSGNQMQRQILIPGLQPRTANGSTGANQLLGQIETGYKLGIWAPAAATVTPFARLQASSINQAAFSEWGANSLSLNVSQQTTTSVRSTFGADLAGAIGLGDARTLDLGLRLGWLHEYANTARPITAAFAGAPSAAFTVYGATPQRDSAVIGFSAATAIASSAQLYLRYDGEVGGGTDNHALTLGARFSW